MEEDYELDEELPINNKKDIKLEKDMNKIMNKLTNIKTEADKKKLYDEMQYELKKIENETKDPKQRMKERLAEMKKNRGKK